ncbi:MAG: hypothetical protein LBQ61_02420 [Spirochaetales bacterium]|jgi:hypothetical protein|nr:hypothetical protein [Spirochaetales bacterium]
MNQKKGILILAFILFAGILGLPADSPAGAPGYTVSNTLGLVGSTLPEAKLTLSRSYVFPFLQGAGPLTRDNNLSLTGQAEVSPVSLNGIIKAVWTPIAFLQFTAGGRIGSGWTVSLLGTELFGIGINDSTTGEAPGKAFDGFVWSALAGGTFQFDLAALFPGDWNHVLVRAYQEINYFAYSKAQAGDSWYFEASPGENRNGLNFYGSYVLGYSMPIFLNTAALMAEVETFLYDTAGGELWGDDLGRWVFSLVLNFTITQNLSLAVIPQLRTVRSFTAATEDAPFYQDRRLDSPARELEFFRVAFNASWRF